MSAGRSDDLLTSNQEDLASSFELFDSLGFGAILFDGGLNICSISAAARHLLGLPDGGANESIQTLDGIFENDKFSQAALNALDSHEHVEIELPVGATKWISIGMFPRGRLDMESGAVLCIVSEITEDLEELDRLKERADRFGTLVEATSQIVWQNDETGRVVEDSPSWRSFTGQSREAWLNESWAAVVHPDDLSTMARTYEVAAAKLEPYQLEFRLWHAASETYRWISATAVPRFYSDGRFRGYVGMNTDITEERARAAKLRASALRMAYRAKLSEALRTLSDPAPVKRIAAQTLGEYLGASRVHYAEIESNDAFANVEDEYVDGVAGLSGRHRMDDYGPAIADDVRAGRIALVQDVRTDTRLTNEERTRTLALQTEAYFIVPLHKYGRTQAALVIHFRDPHEWSPYEKAMIGETAERTWATVERAKSEQALRESEERFRQAATIAQIGTWRLDIRTGAHEVFERARGILGFGDEPVSLEDFIARFHPEDRQSVTLARNQTLDPEGGGRTVLDYRIELPNGEVRWIAERVHTSFETDPASARRPVLMAGVIMDVTDRRSAEEAVRRINETLEERVVERSEQVRALTARLAAAEQEERARMAHVLHDDLQQQLFGLGVTLGMLRTSVTDVEHDELLTQAEEIVGSATNLTRTLAVELNPTVLSGSSVERLVSWLAETKKSRYGLRTTIAVEEGLEVKQTHVRILLYNALRELLFNVAKHAHVKEADVSVWTEDGGIYLRVSDGGPGFDASHLVNLDRPPPGLGLSSLRERIELIDGSIRIESTPESGTVIVICLPWRKTEPLR